MLTYVVGRAGVSHEPVTVASLAAMALAVIFVGSLVYFYGRKSPLE